MGSFSRKSPETLHLPTLKCDTAFTLENQGLGLTYQLGSEYEKKKRKLLQELQLDYKDYVTKVFPQKNNLKSHEPSLLHKGLSLPINERASIKERLREERNKEYNLFLQEQAQKRRLKRETPPVTSKLEDIQASEVVSVTSQGPPLPFLNTQINTACTHKECPASRRDAATLTEAGDTGGRASNLDPRRRRRWQIHKPTALNSSEEELCTDEEDDRDFSRLRRQHKESPYKEEKRTQKRRMDRAVQDINETEAPVLSHQNNKDGVMESDRKHIPDNMKTAAISTPVTFKDNAESATGLLIGATEDQTITQMKKEQYKQELLRQIAEQQRNKIKEKKLELNVAVTGATDPEKEPDRIKQFRIANQQYEDLRQDAPQKSGIDLEAVGKDANPKDEFAHCRAHGRNSQVDFNTTLSQLPGVTIPGPGMGLEHNVPPFDYFNEDFHGNIPRMPGEVALPRVASVAPIFPPIVPNMYTTAYDAAHSFYRNRNPLEIQDNLHGGFRNFETLPHGLPPVRVNEGSPFATEGLHADMSKQRRENALRYQEALKQQIQEREKHKQSERVEKERSDAKSEGEMMTFDPWGRSGGGAPNKDQHGNVISDLKQMHIINNNRMLSPRAGAGSPFPYQLSGSSHQPPPQQPRAQDRYKEELKQQIEENRRRRAEEHESLRMAVEKEEKRLKEERARMLQQYEEEQRKQKQIQTNAKKKRPAREDQMQHIEEVKSTKQKNQTVPQSAKEKEEKTSLFTYQRDQRQPSPPIPTLQRKHTNREASKPNCVERSLSAPHVQPQPRNIPTPQAGQQEVIKGLSTLRNFLKNEQRQLEQLGLTETYHSHQGRRRFGMDTFEAANKESVYPLARSPASANAEKQNNQLKNGDVLDYRPNPYYSRRKHTGPVIPRNVSLPFEVAFTDKHNVKQLVPRQAAQGPGRLQGSDRTVPSIRNEGSGKMTRDNKGSCEGQITQQGGPQPSEERWEMTASQRQQVVADFLDERKRMDEVANNCQRTAKDTNQNRKRDFERGDHSRKTSESIRNVMNFPLEVHQKGYSWLLLLFSLQITTGFYVNIIYNRLHPEETCFCGNCCDRAPAALPGTSESVKNKLHMQRVSCSSLAGTPPHRVP